MTPGARTHAVKAHLNNELLSPRMELRLKHCDGRWVWALFSGTVVERRSDGQALRMAGICMDIDAQKKLESQLRDNARTDESDPDAQSRRCDGAVAHNAGTRPVGTGLQLWRAVHGFRPLQTGQ